MQATNFVIVGQKVTSMGPLLVYRAKAGAGAAKSTMQYDGLHVDFLMFLLDLLAIWIFCCIIRHLGLVVFGPKNQIVVVSISTSSMYYNLSILIFNLKGVRDR